MREPSTIDGEVIKAEVIPVEHAKPAPNWIRWAALFPVFMGLWVCVPLVVTGIANFFTRSDPTGLVTGLAPLVATFLQPFVSVIFAAAVAPRAQRAVAFAFAGLHLVFVGVMIGAYIVNPAILSSMPIYAAGFLTSIAGAMAACAAVWGKHW